MSAVNQLCDDALQILRDHHGDGSAMYWPELIDALEARGHKCHGDKAIYSEAYPHVIFWPGINEEFCAQMTVLSKAKLIEKWASKTPMTAMLTFPRIPNLPLVTNKRIKRGSKDCWMPSGVKLTAAGMVSAKERA